MLTNLVVSVVRICTRYAALVVAAVVLMTIAATVYTVQNFAITTDINKLISPDLDWRQRDLDFDKTFPGREEMILAVVDAPTPEMAGLAGQELVKVLRSQPKDFKSVEPLGSGPFFDRNGLLYLPTEELRKVTGEFQSAVPLLEVMAGDPSLRGLTGALEFILQGLQRGELKLDQTARPFNMFADSLDNVLAKKPAYFSWRELTSETALADSDKRIFIEIKPVLDYAALEPGKQATDAIHATARQLDLAGKFGARVRLTGAVPIANEEFATVSEGALPNTIGTIVIVLVILWCALHSPKIIFAVFAHLMAGLIITTALGLMIVGALNLISVAFAVLFIGLGVDFGIQFSVRYRSERYKHDNLKEALEHAARRSAVPLSLAAMATAAGFLSFLPTAYVGVSELGKIAGVGMLVAYIGSLTFLPAMLTLLNPKGEAEPMGYAFLAPVDHFLEKHRVPIIAGTLLICLAGAPLLYFLKFDFNPINLRNPNTESIATFLDLRRDPNTGANAITVIAPNEAAAKEVEARLAKVPEVEQTRSLDTLIPADQPEKIRLIEAAAKVVLPALEPQDVDPPPTDAENVKYLSDTAASLRRSIGDQQGPGAVAGKRLADAMQKLAQSDEATRNRAQEVLVAPLKAILAQLKAAMHPQLITADTLPSDLLRSWRAPDGRVRIEALPKGDPNDNETLRRFADAVLAVEPNAIGGPVSILKSGDTIVQAFIEAGIWALISISILLWIALRRVTDVLLTLVPLLVAGALTLEICVLIGLPLNFANIIAIPLLLGVGVAFKIYYVVAWRSGRTDLLQSSLTRAIFYSALTTATAFGSLCLSSHPGTASMGELLALSLFTTLAAVLLFQPALMGRPRDVGQKTDVADGVSDVT